MSKTGLGALVVIAFMAGTPLALQLSDDDPTVGTGPWPSAQPAAEDGSPGLLDRARLKACEVSLATTRRDQRGNRDRSQECERRQGIRT